MASDSWWYTFYFIKNKWKTNPLNNRYNFEENDLLSKINKKYISNNKTKFFFFNLDQEDFTSESIELVKSTILGSNLKAMVTGYHYDNTPFIQLSRRYDFVNIYIYIYISKIVFFRLL